MCASFLFNKAFYQLFRCSCSYRCSHVIIRKLSKAFTVPRVKTNARHWRNWQTNWLHSVQHWTSTQGSDIRSKPRQHFLTNVSNQVYVGCISLIVIFVWTIFDPIRDGNMENAKVFAELVDKKLARHYELDDSETKKVTSLLRNKTTSGS